jgi:signal transduction histidine kinase/CheY-like chemotaxis protein
LIVLIIGTLLPALALAAVLVQRVVDDKRQAVEQQLLETARAEAAVVDAELSGTIRALQALAQSERLSTGDFAAFYDEASRLQATQSSWYVLILHAPDGRAMVHTGYRFGTTLPDIVDKESFGDVVKKGQPMVGSLMKGPRVGQELAFPVRVPVTRNGQLVFVLSAVITPDRLADVLRQRNAVTDEWVRGVVDNKGIIVARTRDAERFVGQQGTPEFLERFLHVNEAVYRDTTLDGKAVYGAFARAPISGWIAGVGVPAEMIDGPFRQSIIGLVGIGLLLFGMGCGGAFLISRRISRDIANAAVSADAIARGTHPEIASSSVIEIQQLSDALARSAALLDARQRERDEQVARADAARTEAEAADRAKDDFLAMLGHELRNPLAPVLTALELMRLRGDTSSARERNIIERQVRHLVRLVDDLLDVSRVRRGRIELRRQPIELIRAVEKAVEIAQPIVAARDHRLTVDVPPGGLAIDGDETRLAQVFANLLTNAAKYSNHPGHIILRARAEGDRVIVECQDDGIGIAPDLLPRIFDLFAQGRQLLDRREGGLGLGLAVARTLVELHGGTIEASSTGPGHGSVFTVRLPRVASAVVEAHPRASEEPMREGATCRVLVVDDNQDAADMLAQMLRVGGFDVAVEFDGLAALARLERFGADVAILDIGLPSIDGLALARRIREVNPHRSIRLVAVTGYGQESDVAASYAAGFDLHLVKPVSADALFDALRSSAPAGAD